jgi:hypothetical protein
MVGSVILVVVESHYAGDVEANLDYLRACLRDCLLRGEAPFASHALYTQPGVLRDEVPAERELGMDAGFCWRHAASKTVVYTDRGMSGGMRAGIAHAEALGQPVEYRILGYWDSPTRPQRSGP